MNGKGKRMATLMAKKLPMTHKWVCLEWQRRDVFFCNDRVFSLCILVPTREPSWTEAWIGSCTQLVQKNGNGRWSWQPDLSHGSTELRRRVFWRSLAAIPSTCARLPRLARLLFLLLTAVVCSLRRKDCCFQHSRQMAAKSIPVWLVFKAQIQ